METRQSQADPESRYLTVVFRKPGTHTCKCFNFTVSVCVSVCVGGGGFHHNCVFSPAPRASQQIRPPR